MVFRPTIKLMRDKTAAAISPSNFMGLSPLPVCYSVTQAHADLVKVFGPDASCRIVSATTWRL